MVVKQRRKKHELYRKLYKRKLQTFEWEDLVNKKHN